MRIGSSAVPSFVGSVNFAHLVGAAAKPVVTIVVPPIDYHSASVVRPVVALVPPVGSFVGVDWRPVAMPVLPPAFALYSYSTCSAGDYSALASTLADPVGFAGCLYSGLRGCSAIG